MLLFSQRKHTTKMHCKINWSINKTKSLTADFELETIVSCVQLESFAVRLTGITGFSLGLRVRATREHFQPRAVFSFQS